MKKSFLFLSILVLCNAFALSGCRQEEAAVDRMLLTLKTLQSTGQDQTDQLSRSLDYLQYSISQKSYRSVDTILLRRAQALHAATLKLAAHLQRREGQLVADAQGPDLKTKLLQRMGDLDSWQKEEQKRYYQDSLPGLVKGLSEQISALVPQAIPDSTTLLDRTRHTIELLSRGAISGAIAMTLLTSLRVECLLAGNQALGLAGKIMKQNADYVLRPLCIVWQSPYQVREGDTCRLEFLPMEYASFTGNDQPLMYANGKRVPVENGIGKVRFTARQPAGKKTWEGKITLSTPSGRDTSFYCRQDYWIVN